MVVVHEEGYGIIGHVQQMVGIILILGVGFGGGDGGCGYID